MFFVVLDPATGRHIRPATPTEAEEYRQANPDRVWERPTVLASGILVDTYYGPGSFYIPLDI